MPKVGMEPIRKRQVIDATMACIHEEGIANASLQRIARRAEIASGLIPYYFGDKEGLFEAVYRDLYKRLADETIHRLKRAKTPIDRLFAVLEAQMSNEMVEPRVVATWFTLSAKAFETPGLARMERINARRLVSNLVHTLKTIGVSHAEAMEIAEELMTMIYGIWPLLAHGTIKSPEQARNILFRFIKNRIPQLAD